MGSPKLPVAIAAELFLDFLTLVVIEKTMQQLGCWLVGPPALVVLTVFFS